MSTKHLPPDMRPHHPRRDELLEGSRVSAFRRWTRENLDREPTRAEITEFLKGLK